MHTQTDPQAHRGSSLTSPQVIKNNKINKQNHQKKLQANEDYIL